MGLQMGLQMGLHFAKNSITFGGGQMGVNAPYLWGFGSLSGGGYFGQNGTIFQLFSRKTLQNRYLYIIKEATVEVASSRSIKLPIRFCRLALIYSEIGYPDECGYGI